MPQRAPEAPGSPTDSCEPGLVRHDSELGFWESVTRTPDPRIAGLIEGPYQGWIEKTVAPMSRRETPAGIVPVILNLGPPYGVLDPTGRSKPRYLGSFVAGLHESFALIESTGFAICLQFNLSLLGAYQFLGVPMNTLVNQTIELEDVLGHCAPRLTARLQNAADWETRFRLLDAFIADRVAKARPVSPAIGWAWRQLEDSGGLIDVRYLASELRCSHKHLITLFRREIGLPPKMLARIIRFNEVVTALKATDTPRWTEIAYRCGYYDQAHLIRDFREFAGSTPSEFLGRILPDGGGVAGF
jgi:AraC-like DNA-binding protein